IKLDADFEEAKGGEHAGGLSAAAAVENVQGFFEAEFGIGRDGERIPEIEGVIAAVIVGEARGVVDKFWGVGWGGIFDAGGNEGALVGEGFGIKDGADLADEGALGGGGGFKGGDAANDFVFIGFERAGDLGKRAFHEGNLRLEEVEELMVDGVEFGHVYSLQ